MQRVEPVLSEQLTRNTESHAFDGEPRPSAAGHTP